MSTDGSGMGRSSRAAAACLLAGGVLVPGPATADTTPARIMIVGDSVTQGDADSYTWRYRLWKTLEAQHKAVDFVGPRRELRAGSAAYADAEFDQDHAARWGAMFTEHGWWVTGYDEDVTQDLVATYAPDVVIEDLGVNNLLLGADPADTIGRVENFVADVRAVRPGASVVLGQLTQHWFDGVDAFNAMLVDVAADLDRPDARVLVAPAPSDYTQATDTYDGSHPSALGEVKIAAQFASVLATLPLPTEPVAPEPAYTGSARLAAHPRFRAVRLDFTAPRDATRQAIWRRDLTARGRWRLVAYVDASRDHYRVDPLRRHHRYAFRLRAYRGSAASTVYSDVVRARPR